MTMPESEDDGVVPARTYKFFTNLLSTFSPFSYNVSISPSISFTRSFNDFEIETNDNDFVFSSPFRILRRDVVSNWEKRKKKQ